jgi:3-dehydroquinate dehydratase-2
MATYRILVLNGPNLGHIGTRQPEIYGCRTMDDLPAMAQRIMGKAFEDLEIETFQANGEGDLIDRLEKARVDGVQGMVFNAGAYTHTSLAIADCLAWIAIPCVEVHISNVLARTTEPIRQRSYMGASCIGVIAGFGIMGYALALQAVHQHLESKRTSVQD